ncbi:MAG: isopenicillin N synthase family dioxygenase [Thermaurantimonas sp.]
MIRIPTVDLAEFLSEDPTSKKAFVQKLGKAYEEIGFVAVKNHGLSDELRDQLYDKVQRFFSLPEHIKKKYEIEDLAGQRGYTPFGKEHAKGFNTGDLKEFWQFGQWVDEPVDGELYPPNVEVFEVEGFNETGKLVFKTLEKTGMQILRAIALYLGLEEHYFDPYVTHGNSILRAIHYPPITAEPEDAVRAAQHEDINLITLLMGASAAGLEVLNKKGEWIPVTALPEQIIVNVGDMLQRLTNNVLKSTTHRVVNPPREQWHEPRYSIPFFLHPKSSMSLTCLPQCITEDRPKAYSDLTAGEYLEERLREIGLKK